MNNLRTIFTSEAVSGGHPDKVCDQISDAILDACLSVDPYSRVAIETAIKGQTVCILGELTTAASPNLEAIAIDTLNRIGYGNKAWGFDTNDIQFVVNVTRQSEEIQSGVDGSELGAGDQGIMFGFANQDTETLMPAPIELANRLIRKHADLRADGHANLLGPDAKAQVSVIYDGRQVVGIDNVVFSTQHATSINLPDLRELVQNEIIVPVLEELVGSKTKFLINPAGTFHVGGPVADAGLTGRKIIADTYGGFARHGGGAFSGKDATKVDRSGAYAARQIAKHAVASGWIETCEVQIAYAIGTAHPVSVDFVSLEPSENQRLHASFQDTGIDLHELLTPTSIIDRLGLRNPVFQATAQNGHFGRPNFAWESLL